MVWAKGEHNTKVATFYLQSFFCIKSLEVLNLMQGKKKEILMVKSKDSNFKVQTPFNFLIAK